jgi:hypothetical protein
VAPTWFHGVDLCPVMAPPRRSKSTTPPGLSRWNLPAKYWVADLPLKPDLPVTPVAPLISYFYGWPCFSFVPLPRLTTITSPPFTLPSRYRQHLLIKLPSGQIGYALTVFGHNFLPFMHSQTG